MQKRKRKQPHKGWKDAARKSREKKLKGDPLRGNPLVGFISEEQAERILAEIREEKRRGVW
jgi:hypothetical protein